MFSNNIAFKSTVLIGLLLIANSKTTNMDMKALSQTISSFSYKFCNEIEGDKSSVSSPLSAEILLALLTLGSSDQAHKELLKAIGLPDDDTIRASFSKLASSLKATEGVTLNVANKIYLKEGNYELVPQLKEDAVKVFDAALEKINFADGAKAASAINQWVEGKTNNRIKDLLKADDLGEATRLVLVNALYFKGSWEKKFDEARTKNLPFHINSSTTVDVPTMIQSDKFTYAESTELNAQLLRMPYKGNGASMLVVLPRDVEGLRPMMEKLANGFDLTKEIERMRTQKVDVFIPKFKIETTIDLNKLLPKLGIEKIFDSARGGDLTRILNNKESLYVSKAVQKAFIEVNEEGAEAAAATGVVMMLRCAMVPAPSPVFRADRPFLYALLSSDHAPLFLGTFRAQ